MITGMHAIVYCPQAEKGRAFFGDVIGMPSAVAGAGGPSLPLPPADLAVPPQRFASDGTDYACVTAWAASVKRGSGVGLPAARSAMISPSSGANVAPCPEQGDATRKGPDRSRMKSSFAVHV